MGCGDEKEDEKCRMAAGGLRVSVAFHFRFGSAVQVQTLALPHLPRNAM